MVLDHFGVAAIEVSAHGFSFLNAQGQPVGVVTNWNDVLGQVEWSTITNLPVLGAEQIAPGSIDAQHLSFDPLLGGTNVFIHPETGKLAVNCPEGNILRAYRGIEVSDENLTFALRSFYNTSEMVLRRNNEDTVRLRGDGSLYLSGTLQVGALSIGGASGGGSWFIPEQGDLSMGSFTQE